MKLQNIMNQSLLTEMLEEGYVRERHHPYLDLRILNYSEKAQFGKVWNEVTLQCRGLIVNSTDEIIARPFDKFMNYGENQDDKLLMNYEVVITDKMDGSLGILWNYAGEQGIATRGSFISDPACHATQLWRAKYSDLNISEGYTYLFEIVYPENRIVLDYGDMDDLVLLGVRDIEEGYVLLPNEVSDWTGPKSHTFPYATLREALEAPQRPNAEGFVAYFPDLDYRIKIKQEDYLALHKIVFDLTEKRIYQALHTGSTLATLYNTIPDEFHPWLFDVWNKYQDAFLNTLADINADWLKVTKELDAEYPEGWGKRELASVARNYPTQHYLYRKHAGDITGIHNMVRKSIGFYKSQ
jgi:RNA ligase